MQMQVREVKIDLENNLTDYYLSILLKNKNY